MGDWFNITIVISAGLLTLFNLVDKLINAAHKVKEPTDVVKDRLDILERRVDTAFAEYDARFGRDKARLDSIEEGSKVTQKAILALLKHSIDGNNVEGLEDAEKELEKYLINR